MGISFGKPKVNTKEKYRAPRNDMAGCVATASVGLNKEIINLKARLGVLEKTIKGVSSTGDATATNTTKLNTAIKELGTRVNRNVISNAEKFRKLEETLKELKKKSSLRSANNNRSLIGFQLEIQNFEADVLSFLEGLSIDQNSDKRLKEWRKLKTKQRITGREGRLPSFKF